MKKVLIINLFGIGDVLFSTPLLKAIKNETIILGDNQRDIQAGQAAKITTSLFFPKENERFYKLSELMAYKPDYIFSDFPELLTI